MLRSRGSRRIACVGPLLAARSAAGSSLFISIAAIPPSGYYSLNVVGTKQGSGNDEQTNPSCFPPG